jgi:hypothetical protein
MLAETPKRICRKMDQTPFKLIHYLGK